MASTPALAAADGSTKAEPVSRVARHDRQDLALLLAVDQAAAQLARAVEGPVEDDLHHRVEGVGGEVLRRGQEVAGRVVDELVGRAQLRLQRRRSARAHGLRLADVGGGEGGLSAGGADGADRLRRAAPGAGRAIADRAPRPAMRSAIERPRPVPPPVMTVVLPASRSWPEGLEWLHHVLPVRCATLRPRSARAACALSR